MLEFRVLFQRAFAGESIKLQFDNYTIANNLRQRFYRYRDKIRKDTTDELNLLVDHLHFEIEANVLQVHYKNPNEELLEKLQ